jgi:hypothetical protein
MEFDANKFKKQLVRTGVAVRDDIAYKILPHGDGYQVETITNGKRAMASLHPTLKQAQESALELVNNLTKEITQ